LLLNSEAFQEMTKKLQNCNGLGFIYLQNRVLS